MLALLVGLLFLAPGCSTNKIVEKRAKALYGPSESALELIAVLRRHIPDDTYRFEPATDFTGRNVYRGTLLRLENLEQMHADALRTGYLDAIMPFAKARTLERLRAFDLAAGHYREAARHSTALRAEADRSARINDRLFETSQLGIDLVDPLGGAPLLPLEYEPIIGALDERTSQLTDLLEEVRADDFASHYGAVVLEEIERADIARSHYFRGLRLVLPDGQVRAVAELQRVVSRHSASKYRSRHILDLADLYVQLAEEYVLAVPPASLQFDPPRFRELVEAATQLYESVASQDGTPEKLEAARRLESFLAFTLKVDRDRFSQ